MPRGKVLNFAFEISDFEHSGDAEHACLYIRKNCKEAKDVHYTEERDYEAESDYKEEYGELDEPIYKGIVHFRATQKQVEKWESKGFLPL